MDQWRNKGQTHDTQERTAASMTAESTGSEAANAQSCRTEPGGHANQNCERTAAPPLKSTLESRI